jgi:hypothetical protein
MLTVLLVCGDPGPIAAHTPEICFAGAGYRSRGEPNRQGYPSGLRGLPHEFFTADFRHESNPMAETLRVTWGWRASNRWDASASPRMEYAHERLLLKLYIVEHLSGPETGNTNGAASFMPILLPELETLFESADLPTQKSEPPSRS